MANGLTGLTLKRIRSSSTASTKKESKINIILNKLASSLYGGNGDNNNKKRRQEIDGKCMQRKSSASQIVDCFRIADDKNHPFANDAIFEQNRYKQQKKLNTESVLHQSNNVVFDDDNIPMRMSAATGGGILLNKSSHHRHNPSTTSFMLKSSNYNNEMNKKPYQHHRHTHSTPPAITTKPAFISQPLPTATSAGISKSSNSRRAAHSSKHIRHYSHVSCISSSNITVNSEDLTAKEFADIAGIRILSEDELQSSSTNTYSSYHDAINSQSFLSNNNNNNNLFMNNKKKICSVCGGSGDDSDNASSFIIPSTSKVSSNITMTSQHHQQHLTSSNSSDCQFNNSSILLFSSNDNSTLYVNDSNMLIDDEDEGMDVEEPPPPQIWDDDFWRVPNSKQQQQSAATTTLPHQRIPILNPTSSTNNSVSTSQIPRIAILASHNDIIESPPILHELKKYAKSNNFSSDQNSCTYIKRGRFEIHLSDENYSKSDIQQLSTNTATALKRPEMVVEWKRKVRPAPTVSTVKTTS
ncbi:hypothetical protein BDF20DRAFT_836120 [Mycotypha africana]|uniref:uncharacterized protein n=1 Tax=Mycotypha africana TaxID=64632 RepID=UPI002301D0CA|nr:uncharacterized protein BDF20DRAFT_836120 [Mycotypha africana]KAI8977302.1 hypothetical protein BDF20DRAFT_836120 [Mycotypha africana]